MAAGRVSGPGRQDCGHSEASLRPPSSSCDGHLIVGGVALVDLSVFCFRSWPNAIVTRGASREKGPNAFFSKSFFFG